MPVLLTIIANCIVLALEEHLPYHDKTVLAQKLVIHLMVAFMAFMLWIRIIAPWFWFLQLFRSSCILVPTWIFVPGSDESEPISPY
nr:unnamed protein product [Callosobruchus chinensis]